MKIENEKEKNCYSIEFYTFPVPFSITISFHLFFFIFILSSSFVVDIGLMRLINDRNDSRVKLSN